MIRGNSWEPSLASLCSQLFGGKDQAFLFLNTTRNAQSGTKSQNHSDSVNPKYCLAALGWELRRQLCLQIKGTQ